MVSFISRKEQNVLQRSVDCPNIFFDLENSKVKVKNANMPKSVFGRYCAANGPNYFK